VAEPEPDTVSKEVVTGGAETVGEQDGDPVEQLPLERCDVFDVEVWPVRHQIRNTIARPVVRTSAPPV
jgi:hypothetical protein